MKLLVGSLFVLALPFAIARADRPAGHPGPPQAAFDACASAKGPRPEAIAACSGHAAGDACSMTHHGHELTGSCSLGRDGAGTLACHPAGGPPPR